MTLSKPASRQQPHHVVAAFVHAAVFSGDGGLANPVLQALNRFVVVLVDRGLNSVQIGGVRGATPAW